MTSNARQAEIVRLQQRIAERLCQSACDEQRAAQSVSCEVAGALERTHHFGRALLGQLADCATAAVTAADADGRRAAAAAHGALLGALRGTRESHVWAVDVVAAMSAALIRSADLSGVDPALLTRGALNGAIDSAHELEFSAAESVAAAATAALRAAADLGPVMLDRVRAAIPARLGGVPVVIRELSAARE